MERGTIGLAVGAAIAIWAFLSITGTHDQDRAAKRAELAAERAEFDRDLARLTGAPSDEQEAAKKRAAEAERLAQAARQEAEQQAAVEREKRRVLEEAAEADVRKNGGPDLTAAEERILKTLHEKGDVK